MPRKFRYLEEEDSTRKRSHKQESRIARELRGYTTVNSGATFGQNDVITDFAEVEAKTTSKESFTLTLADWRKLRKKCSGTKLPIFVIDFEACKDKLAVLPYEDLQFLINQANSTK